MAGFVERLEEINALADSSPGFVWRLQCENGDATTIRIYDDPTILVNLSVWETVGQLRDFVYRSFHRELLRARATWFAPLNGHHLVVWPVAIGHEPAIDEACARLELLRREGPSERAFTFASTPENWRG